MAACETLFGTSLDEEITPTAVITQISTIREAGSTSIGSSAAEVVTACPSGAEGDNCTTSTRFEAVTQIIPGDESFQTILQTQYGTRTITSIFPTATNCPSEPEDDSPSETSSTRPASSTAAPVPSSSIARSTSSSVTSSAFATSIRSSTGASSSARLSTVLPSSGIAEADPAQGATSVSYVTSIIVVTAQDGSQSTSSVLTPVLAPDGRTSSAGGHSNIAAIAGGAIGGVIGLILLVLLLLGCFRGKGPFASCRPTDTGFNDQDWAPTAHRAEKENEDDDDEDEMGQVGVAPVQFDKRHSSVPSRRISQMSHGTNASRPASTVYSDEGGPGWHGLAQDYIPPVPVIPSADMRPRLPSPPGSVHLHHRPSLPLGYNSLPASRPRNQQPDLLSRRLSAPLLQTRPTRPRPPIKRLSTSHQTTESISTLESAASSAGPVTPSSKHDRERYDLHIVGEEDYDLPQRTRNSIGTPTKEITGGFKLHLVTDLDEDVQQEKMEDQKKAEALGIPPAPALPVICA